MDLAFKRTLRFLAPVCLLVPIALGLVCVVTSVSAGLVGGGGGGRAVGGVIIDAAGVVRTATADEKQQIADMMRQHLAPAEGELDKAAELRMISLSGLQQAIVASDQTGEPMADEVEFLAGLQRIDYVFVDADKQDIVLAGPAEPWKMLDDGSVVGTVTGGATMRLADLVVAMRSVETARQTGISCSIEPTPEGRRRLQQMLSRVKLRPGQNPVALEASMKEAYGPQMIHLTGVPADTRYARTLVAADFEMKRIAMGLASSPIEGLPSYLEMSKNGRHGAAQNPRWWMACDYDSLAKNEEGTAWKLSGKRVKTLTEQDLVAADGRVSGAGRTDKLAQQWANKMTSSYTELAREMPVFGDLRNLMDMTVVATLITQERLAEAAGLDLAVLSQPADALQLASYTVPRSVDPQCSFIHGRAGWVVTASGGVDISAFEIVEKQHADATVAETRTVALASTAGRWWWNK